MITSRPMLAIRGLLRQIGLTQRIAQIGDVRSNRESVRLLGAYRQNRPATVTAAVGAFSIQLKVDDESEFSRAMTFQKDRHLIEPLLSAIGDGDVFWDIGANFGLYGLLAARVPGARAVLFDPDPWCAGRIRENIAINGCTNVELAEMALSDLPGVMRFQPADRSVNGTSHLLDREQAGSEAIEVPVVSGDSFRTDRKLSCPNALKIDVEGFELEVLRGLRQSLSEPACRCVLVEVHFGLLADRGMKLAPREIVEFLTATGFDQIRWPDASHLWARKSA